MYDPSRDPRLFERKIDANGDEYEVMLPPPARGKHGLSQPSDPSVAGIQRRNTQPPLYYSQGPEPSGPCLVGGWSADLLLEIRYLATRAIEERWEEWNPQWPRAVIRFLSRLIGDREAGAYKCVCHWSTMSRDVGLERTDLVSWEVWRCHNYLVDTNDELWTQGQAHVHITPENAKQMIEIARRALPRQHAHPGPPLQITRLPGVYAQRELQNGKEDCEREDWLSYPVALEAVSPRRHRALTRPPPPIRGVERLDLPPRTMRLGRSQKEEERANVNNSLTCTPPRSQFEGFSFEGADDADLPRRGIPYVMDEVGDAHGPNKLVPQPSNSAQYGPRRTYVRRPMSPPAPNPRPNPLDPRLRNRRPQEEERDQLAKTKSGRIEKSSEGGVNVKDLKNVLPKLRDEAARQDGDHPTAFFTASLEFRPKNNEA